MEKENVFVIIAACAGLLLLNVIIAIPVIGGVFLEAFNNHVIAYSVVVLMGLLSGFFTLLVARAITESSGKVITICSLAPILATTAMTAVYLYINRAVAQAQAYLAQNSFGSLPLFFADIPSAEYVVPVYYVLCILPVLIVVAQEKPSRLLWLLITVPVVVGAGAVVWLGINAFA